jgi:hypothetical protein
MSNWVVSGKRLSPRTMLGRRTVPGTSGQQLVQHVLAELLGAGVGVVVGALPVDDVVLGDDLVLALAADGDGGDVGEAAQAVVVLGVAGELDDAEGAAQVDVEAGLGRLAVQRGGDVEDAVHAADQGVAGGGREAEAGEGEVAEVEVAAGADELEEALEAHVELHGLPQALLGLGRRLGADQEGEAVVVALEQAGGDVGADVAGGAGEEDGHGVFRPLRGGRRRCGRCRSGWSARSGRRSRGGLGWPLGWRGAGA